MSIFDLFSKRQKRYRGEVPEVFEYESIPKKLRIQVIHIIRDTIGDSEPVDQKPEQAYKNIHQVLSREYGEFTLGDGASYKTDQECLFTFFLNENNYEKAIDFIELSFRYIEEVIGKLSANERMIYYGENSPANAIEELNERFKEHGVGYQYEGGIIIRLDSTYMHTKVTKPTIALLWNKKFKGSNDEFLKAHEHYRHGRNIESLAECLKAFESTMKIICHEKGWSYSQNDTSRKLIQTCFVNGLVPAYIQSQFTSLRSLLESGVPTIRNRVGGHGQGKSQQNANNELTRYALNLTGANIIFLIEQSGIK